MAPAVIAAESKSAILKSLHVVAVDGFSLADDIVHIRDPWEGTKYDMTVTEFEHIWSGLTILRVK